MLRIGLLRTLFITKNCRFLSDKPDSKRTNEDAIKSKAVCLLNKSFEDGKFTGFIPEDKLEITYSTSSGPGGQNVNRVQTKATVHLHLPSADWIPVAVKLRIRELYKNSISKEDYWIIRSEKTRKQEQNFADCLAKIRYCITQAMKPTEIELTPEELKLIEKRKRQANERRLEDKRRRSMNRAMKNNDF